MNNWGVKKHCNILHMAKNMNPKSPIKKQLINQKLKIGFAHK